MRARARQSVSSACPFAGVPVFLCPLQSCRLGSVSLPYGTLLYYSLPFGGLLGSSRVKHRDVHCPGNGSKTESPEAAARVSDPFESCQPAWPARTERCRRGPRASARGKEGPGKGDQTHAHSTSLRK